MGKQEAWLYLKLSQVTHAAKNIYQVLLNIFIGPNFLSCDLTEEKHLFQQQFNTLIRVQPGSLA